MPTSYVLGKASTVLRAPAVGTVGLNRSVSLFSVRYAIEVRNQFSVWKGDDLANFFHVI